MKITLKLGAAGLILFASSVVAHATTLISIDGSWWNSHPTLLRFYAIQGIVSGLEEGSGMETIKFCFAMGDSPGNKSFNKCYQHNVPHFSKKFVVYMDDVTDFYATYDNATNVTVASIVWCNQDGFNPDQASRCERSAVNLST